MGNIIQKNNLQPFAKIVVGALEYKGWKLKDLAENVETDLASMSRYLRLERRPPARIIDRIIEVLNLSAADSERLRKTLHRNLIANKSARPSRLRPTYQAVRHFAEYDLYALIKLVQSLGWHVEESVDENEYAYDLKVSEAEGLEDFVLINLPSLRRAKGDTLRKGAAAMAANYEGVKATLYYEGVAGGLAAFQDVEMQNEMPLENTEQDAWLRQATGDKGRIVHGGNLIQVLADYLEPTDSVKDYLETHS